MELLWLAGSLAAVLCAMVILTIRHTAKIKLRISEQFGHIPRSPQLPENAASFYKSYAAKMPYAPAVDNLTWENLDLDSIFMVMNNCQSAAGDAHLYSLLRRPVIDAGQLRAQLFARNKLHALFAANAALRLKVQYALARLGRADSAGMEMTVFHPEAITLNRQWLFILLALLPFAGIALAILNPTWGIVVIGLALMANFNVSAVIKRRADSGFRAVRFFAASLNCSRRMEALLANHSPETFAVLHKVNARFAKTRISILLMCYNELIESSIGFDPMALFLAPVLSYMHISRQLTLAGEDTLLLFSTLGEVDTSISLLSYRQTLPLWCEPTLLPNPGGVFEGVFHPLLPHPVANNYTAANHLLLTGSNASGKSTFIKSVALNCIFAQTTGICTASRFDLFCGQVATSMAVEDSIIEGDSYFIAEIKSMRRLFSKLENGAFCWFFIDEILKGTNTIERIGASAAVLGRLAQENCLVFAATHDIELTTILKQVFCNCHFRETVTNDGILFDYRLHEGPAITRNAIKLLEKMDFPADVIANAHEAVALFEDTGEWKQIHHPSVAQ